MVQFSVFAPESVPEVVAGDSLPELIGQAFADFPLKDGDILVLAHKIVSKAEGRLYRLDSLSPTERAKALGEFLGKEPALIQLILEESSEVLWSKKRNGPMICHHRLGFVCANAAVDCSNTQPDSAVALPVDPDRSAARIRRELEKACGIRIGVLICDTHGRAFRNGACGVAVGASGILALRSYVGEADRVGRLMHSSVECYADELASAATLIMGQGSEGRPVAVIRGFSCALGDQTAAEIVRPEESDIFLQALKSSGV